MGKERGMEEMVDSFAAILVLVGAFLVFGSVGGMEKNFINLIEGTYCSLTGFALIAIAIFIANRKEN